MGNCTSSLNTGMFIVDFNNRDEILSNLHDLLMIDGDLTENEDYFQEDTLELGYETEAERIMFERTKGRKLTNEKEFRAVMDSVWEAITGQEYFGACEYDILELGDGRLVVAWVSGGSWD